MKKDPNDLRLYSISYDFKHGDFLGEELRAAGRGGCDAIIIHSIIYRDDGKRSEGIIHVGGNGKPLSVNEVLLSFGSLAEHLAKQQQLPKHLKNLCELVVHELFGEDYNLEGET